MCVVHVHSYFCIECTSCALDHSFPSMSMRVSPLAATHTYTVLLHLAVPSGYAPNPLWPVTHNPSRGGELLACTLIRSTTSLSSHYPQIGVYLAWSEPLPKATAAWNGQSRYPPEYGSLASHSATTQPGVQNRGIFGYAQDRFPRPQLPKPATT
jgi:hypothetical protein